MADEALSRAGLHFDELNKIRVLEPEVQTQTSELKEECKEFVDSKLLQVEPVLRESHETYFISDIATFRKSNFQEDM